MRDIEDLESSIAGLELAALLEIWLGELERVIELARRDGVDFGKYQLIGSSSKLESE